MNKKQKDRLACLIAKQIKDRLSSDEQHEMLALEKQKIKELNYGMD